MPVPTWVPTAISAVTALTSRTGGNPRITKTRAALEAVQDPDARATIQQATYGSGRTANRIAQGLIQRAGGNSTLLTRFVGNIFPQARPILDALGVGRSGTIATRGSLPGLPSGLFVPGTEVSTDTMGPVLGRWLGDEILRRVGITSEGLRSRIVGAIESGITRARTTSDLAGLGIEADIDDILSPAMSTADTFTGDIIGLIDTVDTAAGGVSDALGISLLSGIDAEISRTSGITDRITGGIGAAVEGAIKPITDFVKGALDKVFTAMRATLDKVIAAVGELIGRVTQSIQAVVAEVGRSLSAAWSQVTGTINAVLEAITQYVTQTYDALTRAIDASLGQITQVTVSIVQTVERAIDELIGTAKGGLTAVTETLASVPQALRDIFDELPDFLKINIADPLGALPESFLAAVQSMLAGAADGDTAKIEQASKAALIGEEFVASKRGEYAELFNKVIPESPVMRFAFSVLLGLIMLVQIGGGIARAQSDIVLQEWHSTTPSQLLPPAELINGVRRGTIDRDKLVADIKRQGFAESDIETLLKSSDLIADESRLIQWWLRGLIDDDGIVRALKGRGYTDGDIDHFKTAAFFIPPAADLITMAVREAFSPEVAERFGQFEDFPEAFAQWAKRQGISEDWARRYWAAHWALPSPQQGFEMLHRGIIDEATLKVLLRALDVMPFWREKLIGISYSPYTRVDIRRMHKVGVLSRDQVKRAYQDIGYDDTKAETLTTFTERLNAPDAPDPTDELDGITRATVVGMYSDGILDRPTAFGLLEAIGFSHDVAELFLINADHDEQRRERAEQVGLILDRAKVGVITFGAAQDELHALGLTTREIEKAVIKLVRAESARVRLPSRADLDRMYRAGLVDDAEYLNTLQRLGYSQVWASRYLALVQPKDDGKA